MTRIAFAGAEVGSHRVLLDGLGVRLVSASYWGYRRRGLPKKGLDLTSRIPEHLQVVIESGALRADTKGTDDELREVAADYDDFIATNYDRLVGFTEFDSSRLGPIFRERTRKAFEGDSKFWPVWKAADGFAELADLASRFPNVAIPNDAVEDTPALAAQAITIQRQTGVTFHALGCGKPDNLRQVPFDIATTLAWMSPMKRAELIVWDGSRIARYPKDRLSAAIPRHRTQAIRAGLDIDLYMEGNGNELCKLAVWSFLQLEERVSRETNTSDDSSGPLYTGLADLELRGSTDSAVAVRNAPRPRDPQQMVGMPVFGFDVQEVVDQDHAGRDYVREVPVVSTPSVSLRQCDTCFVAANCPAFAPGTTCAFKLPLELRTKPQVKAVITSILEMQAQRIAFMRFAEEANGGYADPNLSSEIDRFMGLLSTVKKLDSTEETLKIEMSRRAEGGVLSSIFGDRASMLRELPNGGLTEDQTTKMITSYVET